MTSIWFAAAALFMASVASGATTYTMKTYETNAQYLVGNSGQKIRCSTDQSRALTFNILQGVSGMPGHKSLRSTAYQSHYITGDQQDEFLRLLRLKNTYIFGLLASFKEKTNHYFHGTSSYESILFPGYFMICKNGQLQFVQPRTDNQAMRASFVLDPVPTSPSLWGPCSRSCGGGTQERRQTCVFGFCEELQKRRCNRQICPSKGPCTPNPCQNGGTCSTNFWGRVKCTCPPGYKGNRCQNRIHPCDSLKPCKNRGVCRKVGLNYRCVCKNGYTGVHCETAPHPCESDPCQNGGTCIAFSKDYICRCNNRYTGKNCETRKRERCTQNYCRNGGSCVETASGGLSCNCPAEYEGDRCQTAKNPCDNNPCMNGGDCQRTGATTFKCNCKPHFTGPYCETPVPNPCDKRPCLNGGTCVRKGATDFTCNCSPQFTGPICGTPVNPCINNPCQNGGTCSRVGAKDFTCNCKPQFTGPLCETREMRNPCQNNPCQNGGTCIRSGASGFTCNCKPQFTGHLCQTPVPHPCDSDPCLNGGTCVRFSKTFVCNCDPKFTGKTCDTPMRQSCTSTYCQNGGTCVETNTGLKCNCAPGWQGDRCQNALQGFDWSACSRTCGPGTRYRKCRADDTRRCERRYEDCNLRACPNVQCTTYRLDTATQCCKKPTSTACGVPTPPSTARRIIGGTKAKVAQWPWQIAMWKKVPKIFFCGGALVSPNWVVTAGHCARMSGVAQHEMQIVAGTNVLSGNNPGIQTSDVEKIITHPTFKNPIDDIALLKMTKSFTFTQYVKPICFPQGEVIDQDVICYAAGWGAASEADITARRPSNDLLYVGLRTLPMDACVQGFKHTGFAHGVTDKTLCAGVLAGGKDTCIGDSGGPFVCQRKDSCQWFLAGIGSFGPTQCGIGYIPAVFMDVAKYEDWLKKQIAEN